MDSTQYCVKSPDQAVDLKNDLIPHLRAISSGESKFGSLTILIVTIIIFFSAQILSVTWQEILILIVVLLFHETGHLLAMKLFRYSDVKMFFIPFFGAAVSGKSLNDTAVKSCIVSLMGPLPGIIAGVLLYILFILTRNYYVLKTAQVMLLLNAFNFLPIMPLDGGRCVDALFVNSRYFRLIFALIGAGVLVLLAFVTKGPVIGILGVISLYLAFSNFKLHGISSDLKSRGVNAASVDDLLADQNEMQIVIDRLQAGYPKLFTPAVIHRAIFNKLTVIVDTIRFVPAKLLSKIIVLPAYLALVSTSVLVTFLFLAANYTEKLCMKEVGGKTYACVERYSFGKKRSECPIDADLFFNGKGTAFDFDGSVTDVFYYSKGYRTGEWLTFDKTGAVLVKRTYEKGRLVSVSKLEGGTWRISRVEDLPFLGRVSEEIQRVSQPFKSNYRYFSGQGQS